jgi:hypothetical protein
MIGAGPYRSLPYSTYEENELWLRLDLALERALRHPVAAYAIACDVYMDSWRHSDVRRAACELMQQLFPTPS